MEGEKSRDGDLMARKISSARFIDFGASSDISLTFDLNVGFATA